MTGYSTVGSIGSINLILKAQISVQQRYFIRSYA